MRYTIVSVVSHNAPGMHVGVPKMRNLAVALNSRDFLFRRFLGTSRNTRIRSRATGCNAKHWTLYRYLQRSHLLHEEANRMQIPKDI